MVTALLLCVLFVLTAQGIQVGPWDSGVAHGIRGTISFPNPNTLFIEDFSFDGGGVTVFLYYYPPGQAIDGVSGTELPVPGGGGDGRFNRAYRDEDLMVNLPTGVTACDMGALTVWCRPFFATFSRVTITRDIFVNNGVGECTLLFGNTDLPEAPVLEFDNCISFSPSLQLSWTVDRENSRMNFEICSCRSLEAGTNQYMGFGLSGDNSRTFMVGADATIAWVDNTDGKPNAEDYHLSGRFQCRGGSGVCPDTLITGQTCTDDVISSRTVGGIRNENQQCVAFARPFTTSDSSCDINFDPDNMNQYIVWAIGGWDQTAFIHFSRSGLTTPPVHLGRSPLKECSTSIVCARCPPFVSSRLEIPQNATLRMTIGPSAGERGYMGITGQAGWGISWYVNGTLIPEIVVQRGSTYTFIVEGGVESNGLSRYHPLYITNSINGGRLQNSQAVQAAETVYAGFDAEGNPIGVGRLCEYSESLAAANIRETCGSVDSYLRELTSQELTCDTGNSNTFTWTPDSSTPDLVYYQCGTHLNLGWRIIVNGGVPTVSIISITSTVLMILVTLVLV